MAWTPPIFPSPTLMHAWPTATRTWTACFCHMTGGFVAFSAMQRASTKLCVRLTPFPQSPPHCPFPQSPQNHSKNANPIKQTLSAGFPARLASSDEGAYEVIPQPGRQAPLDQWGRGRDPGFKVPGVAVPSTFGISKPFSPFLSFQNPLLVTYGKQSLAVPSSNKC